MKAEVPMKMLILILIAAVIVLAIAILAGSYFFGQPGGQFPGGGGISVGTEGGRVPGGVEGSVWFVEDETNTCTRTGVKDGLPVCGGSCPTGKSCGPSGKICTCA